MISSDSEKDHLDSSTSSQDSSIFEFYDHISSEFVKKKFNYFDSLNIISYKTLIPKGDKEPYLELRIIGNNKKYILWDSEYVIGILHEPNKHYKYKYIFFPHHLFDDIVKEQSNFSHVGSITSDKANCWGVDFEFDVHMQNKSSITLKISHLFAINIKLPEKQTFANKFLLKNLSSPVFKPKKINFNSPIDIVTSSLPCVEIEEDKADKNRKLDVKELNPIKEKIQEESNSEPTNMNETPITTNNTEEISNNTNTSDPPNTKNSNNSSAEKESKSESQNNKPKARRFCLNHIRGSCRYGDNCRYNHDLGNIPCRFGRRCRNNNCRFKHKNDVNTANNKENNQVAEPPTPQQHNNTNPQLPEPSNPQEQANIDNQIPKNEDKIEPQKKKEDKSSKPCIMYMKGRCTIKNCRLNHNLGGTPCKYGHKCTIRNCKFKHNPWENKNNCAIVTFDTNECPNTINFKISSLEHHFNTKSIPFEEKTQKTKSSHFSFAFSLLSDVQALEFKTYFDNIVETKNNNLNSCEIISRTKFFETVDKSHFKENKNENVNVDPKNCFTLFVLKNGTSAKDFSSAIEKLKKFDHFVKVIEAEPKGNHKGWVKVLFRKMTPQIASIFYDSKASYRFRHPKFNNCLIKLSNLKIACSICKMIGHEGEHCCEGLKEIVNQHGPYLKSKFTFVPSDEYYFVPNNKIKNNFFVNMSTNYKKSTFLWKNARSPLKSDLNQPPQTNEVTVKKQTLNTLGSNLLKTRNVDVIEHLEKYCKTINDNKILLEMGSSNWKYIFEKHFSDFKTKVEENEKIELLQIYNVLHSNLSKKNFTPQGNNLIWITKFFIFNHCSLLLSIAEENSKKNEKIIFEMKKNLHNIDKSTFAIINAMNRVSISRFRLLLGYDFKTDQEETENKIENNVNDEKK
jgi:hypothetical protein